MSSNNDPADEDAKCKRYDLSERIVLDEDIGFYLRHAGPVNGFYSDSDLARVVRELEKEETLNIERQKLVKVLSSFAYKR